MPDNPTSDSIDAQDDIIIEDPIRVRPLTMPCQAFLKDTYELVRYDDFLHTMAGNLDKIEGTPVAETGRDEDGALRFEAWRASIPYGYALAEFVLLRSEMYCARLVESFLTYLADLLTLVFTSEPAMFQTDQMYKASYVLGFASMEDLRAAMVERKVTALAMDSLTELTKYFNKVFNFDLFNKKYEMDAVQELIEIRNLVVHNRGVVNRTFIEKTQSKIPLGGRIIVGQDTLLYAFAVLIQGALRIDTAAAGKFLLLAELYDLPALQASAGRAGLLFHLHPQNFPGTSREGGF